MKYLLLLLCSMSLQAEWKNRTLTEEDLIKDFVALNLLDMHMNYTTLRDFDAAIEANPVLGPDPSLERLFLHKAVVTGTLYYLLDRDSIKRERDLKMLNNIYMGVVLHNGYIGFEMKKRF